MENAMQLLPKTTISRNIAEMENPIHRIITFETNFNQKLGCDAMVHIDLAPRRKPMRSDLEKTIIEIRTADQSYPPTKWKLYDLMFETYQKINDILAVCSHGMTDMELADYMFNKHHPDFTWKTEVAIYFYLKFKV